MSTPIDLHGYEQTFGAPVAVTTDPPVTVGTDDLVCHPHDLRGVPTGPLAAWAHVTYVTHLDGIRAVWCCERCLSAFVWQCSRDGAVHVRWAGRIDPSTTGRVDPALVP